MQSLETFVLEKVGNVGIVRMNRPKVSNAINAQMLSEIELITQQVEDNPDLLCIILTGEGKHFCAGVDFSLLGQLNSKWSVQHVNRIHAHMTHWENLTCPTIAAIDGACMGAGLEWALTCDIRIAAADAIFSMPEVSFGLSPDMGGSQRLTRTVGASTAKKLLLTSEKFNAQEALRIGIIDEVAEAGQVMETAMAMAIKIASQPPIAARIAKKAVNVAMESSLQAGLLFEQVQSMYTLGTKDSKEALVAFLEKRTPDFQDQ